MRKKKLTIKQQRFYDFYDGNGVEAARKAGYKGSYGVLNQIAIDNLQKPIILEAIQKRERKRNKKHILTRIERQEFWSKIINRDFTIDGFTKSGKKTKVKPNYSEMLKASELLGKSEADFVNRMKFETPADVTINVKITDD